MTVSWVVGSGGLLGSALVRTMRMSDTQVYLPTLPFMWADGPQLHRQLAAALSQFAVQAKAAGAWEIYWAAGVGAMGSQAAELESETAAWRHLLSLIASNPHLCSTPGRIALASSAGSIFAGLQVDVIDETCPDAPTTPYANAKLQQEQLLWDFAALGLPLAALAARISTLYGPGQAHGRRQGLIAHMARSIVHNRPVKIFVPLDTVRDYIAADDAAVGTVEALRASGHAGARMRIVASEWPTTIAEIVNTFHRIAWRAPLISTSANPLGALYLRRVQFRSAWRLPLARPKIGLPVGIAQVLAAERLAFARGG